MLSNLINGIKMTDVQEEDVEVWAGLGEIPEQVGLQSLRSKVSFPIILLFVTTDR